MDVPPPATPPPLLLPPSRRTGWAASLARVPRPWPPPPLGARPGRAHCPKVAAPRAAGRAAPRRRPPRPRTRCRDEQPERPAPTFPRFFRATRARSPRDRPRRRTARSRGTAPPRARRAGLRRRWAPGWRKARLGGRASPRRYARRDGAPRECARARASERRRDPRLLTLTRLTVGGEWVNTCSWTSAS